MTVTSNIISNLTTVLVNKIYWLYKLFMLNYLYMVCPILQVKVMKLEQERLLVWCCYGIGTVEEVAIVTRVPRRLDIAAIPSVGHVTALKKLMYWISGLYKKWSFLAWLWCIFFVNNNDYDWYFMFLGGGGVQLDTKGKHYSPSLLAKLPASSTFVAMGPAAKVSRFLFRSFCRH